MQKNSTRYRNFKYRYIWIFSSIFVLTNACSNNPNLERSPMTQSSAETTTLNIWWEKGFNLDEDEALGAVVRNWEQETGYKTKLSFYTTSELSEKAQRALQGNNLPDVLMSRKASLTLYPRLAWSGKLADVADIVEPVKSLYEENALQAVNYYNQVENKRSFYGVPIYQSTLHIFYWQKLLSSIDRTQQDIPQDWHGFWQFWQQAQDELRLKQQKQIYGLGFPFGIGSTDTYFLFEQMLEAYDITIIDSQGQLLVNTPQVRQGIIKCLDWYSQFYQQGYIPPDTIDWLNTDNNRNLLNRIVLMTPNATLSIPAAIRQDKDMYYDQLGILEFPHKPNGKPMRYLVSVEQAVIFANSPHQQLAKDFLRYLIQPEITTQYLKASGSRHLPVQQSVWQDPFWRQTKDPYIANATETLTQGQTRLFYVIHNPAYSQVLQENIWGKALIKIVVDGLSPEQAADEAITRIKQIFTDWTQEDK